MQSTITGLGLAVFGILAVVLLTSELAAAFAGRDALPRTLQPLASIERGRGDLASAVIGRVLILAICEAVIVGVLISGIASQDPVAEMALIAELLATVLWVLFLFISVRRRTRRAT